MNPLLRDHVGRWEGTNAFRLMPTDPPASAPFTAVVETAAGGQLASVRYRWRHPDDGDQDGLLVLGPGEGADDVVAFWGDSWHQGPQPRSLGGGRSGDGVTVGYAYEAGWRWDITISAAPGRLDVRMDNVPPLDDDMERYAAMAADLRPALGDGPA